MAASTPREGGSAVEAGSSGSGSSSAGNRSVPGTDYVTHSTWAGLISHPATHHAHIVGARTHTQWEHALLNILQLWHVRSSNLCTRSKIVI